MNTVPGSRTSPPRSRADIPLGTNYQVASNILHEAFGELNISPRADRAEVVLTILMEPVKEGSQTGVALDGSSSMQDPFGRAYRYSDDFSKNVEDELKSRGLAQDILCDGQTLTEYTPAGWEELMQRKLVFQS